MTASPIKIDIYKFSRCTAVVKKVIDGDTIDLDVNHGVCIITQRIRIMDVDAPETKGVTSKAGALVKTAVCRMLPEGKIVSVTGQGKDVYGRVLGRIYIDDKDLSKTLLETKTCRSYGKKEMSGGIKIGEWSEDDIESSLNGAQQLIKLYT